MPNLSPKKQLGRLLKSLSSRQDDDCDLSSPQMFEVKFWLRHRPRRITQVKLTPGRISDPSSLLPWGNLPLFLASQITSQNIADDAGTREQLTAILTFASHFLPGNSLPSRDVGTPTLFLCHCAPAHKTYYVFAYICVNMPHSTVYTPDQLLALRGRPPPDFLLSGITHDVTLGEWPRAQPSSVAS